MRILGISAHGSDAAAALLEGSVPVAAVQEERLSRRLGDRAFPLRAIEWCLAQGGVAPERLDAVVFYERPLLRFERTLTCLLRGFPRSLPGAPAALRGALGERLWVKGFIAAHLGVPVERILFAPQHQAHAAAAFFSAPTERAAILIADGAGEWATVSTGRGEHRKGGAAELRLLRELRYPHSLGLLYGAVAAFLGFPGRGGEGAVLALGAWGRRDEDHEAALRRILRPTPDGAFTIDHGGAGPGGEGLARRLVALFGPPRDPQQPLDPQSGEGARWAAIAAAVQGATEDTLVRLARSLQQETGLPDLCVGGGVFQNARANARLLREAGFAQVFVAPAPGSAGAAVGAALWADRVHLQRPGAAVPDVPGHPFLGPRADEADLARIAHEDGLPVAGLGGAATIERAADELARGRLVGWMDGALELGPRALGHRCVLAAPEGAVAARLRALKDRERFIPFSLAVPGELAGRYVDLPPGGGPLGRSLAGIFPLRPEQRGPLAAAAHPDGAARIQLVDEAMTPRLHALLLAVGRRGRPPVLLTTSLRLGGEPIVCRAVEGYSLLLRSALDVLVVGGTVIERPRAGAARPEGAGAPAEEGARC